MGKFDTYKIDFKTLPHGIHELEYKLDNKFFTDIDGDDVQKGKMKIFLTVKHSSLMAEMTFRLEGTVQVPCDRCLDDVDIQIETQNRLIVKFGKEYAEESEEIVTIPEDEGAINLAWFIYEFIALAVPMKHIHPPGKCNKTMSSKLKKHAAKNIPTDEDSDELPLEDDDTIDPRWDALKGIIENDIENE
ncbi:MAG: DUF177 domain-containing protein [Tannerellaceae bacterium]|nr:DUF177 domain-containing protein [Tannerellaceae bacterium]